MEAIKPLSEAVLSTVRSGFIISSLTTVVEELIYNSLDAGARKVLVVVGVNNGYIKVDDDGCGISRDGLVMLGERYATSKRHHLDEVDSNLGTFGFRGEVLCSIADISLLEIVTRIHGRPNGYRKVMKGRKCLYLSIDDRQTVGTAVIVRDLFYNQPVRRRQMQSSAKKVLHSVRECALRIALVQTKIVFKIVDMESEDELLCTYASPSPLSLLHSNFGIDSSSLCELSYSEGSLKLTGYVSAASSSLSSKAVQCICINSRFVVKGPIHKAINRLADLCWDQCKGDRWVKRSQPSAGPSYCLNLCCPRTSYDLNFEVSGTSVEFKDWAPIVAFFEKSVAFLWSKKKRKGESLICEDDLIQKDVRKKAVESMYSAEKSSEKHSDWWLKSCEFTTKRRRIHSPSNDRESAKASPDFMEILVEDDCDFSARQGCWGEPSHSEAKTISFSEAETKVEYPICGNGMADCLWEPDEGYLLDKNVLQNNSNFVRRECNQIMGDDLGAVSNTVGTIWSFGCGQENDGKEPHGHRALVLQSQPWDSTQQTRSDGMSGFELNISKGTRSFKHSVGSEDVVGIRQNEVANTGLLSNVSEESCGWEDVGLSSMAYCNTLPSCKGSFGIRHRESLGEQVHAFSSSSLSWNSDWRSSISNSVLNANDWDPDHLVQDDGLERASVLGSCYSFDMFDDAKEKFYNDDFSERCLDENLPSSSSLFSKVLFENDNAKGGKDVWKVSAHESGADAVSSPTHGDFLLQDTHLSLNNIQETEMSAWWSPSLSINRRVKMGLRRCQALKQPALPGKLVGRSHHTYIPDSLLSSACDEVVAAETVPTCLDFNRRSNTYEAFDYCVSSVSLGKDLGSRLPSFQPREPNCNSLDRVGRVCLRTRRSHSAPPIYRGRRRFLSVYDCVTSATVPQACGDSDGAVLDLPQGPSNLCNGHHHDDDKNSTDDLLCTPEWQVKAPNISQSSRPPDINTEAANFDSGNYEEVHDLESPGDKWRQGRPDVVHVGDRLVDLRDDCSVLDIQSCGLHLHGDSLIPKSINRKCLESAKVLFQLDCKFIPIVAKETLAVIDQHAADERIQLEDMRQKVLSGELKSISYLEEEKDLVLPEMAFQLLCNYADHIKHWGWICNIFREDSSSFTKSLRILNEQEPHLRLIAVPCILGVNLSDADLLEFLEQLAETDGSSTIPPSVIRILNYKACRGAIMFGDKLLPSECSLIVDELKHTSLCFQCAHGRPTTVPLVNLQALHKWIVQLDGATDIWHGLNRKDINLERARRRLDVARGYV